MIDLDELLPNALICVVKDAKRCPAVSVLGIRSRFSACDILALDIRFRHEISA